MPEHFHALIQLVTTDNPPEGYCLVYNFSGSSPTSCQLPSQGSTDNGNVVGYWYQDNVNPSFSHTASYTYDGVNRLTNAVATPRGSGTASYNLTFSYTQDGSNGQYGNMSCVTNAQTVGPCTNLSFNAANNHITTSGYTYDAAGNLTEDSSNVPLPVHYYQWDAEGRVSTVDPGNNPTWTFTYNALGHRVQWVHPGGTDQHFFDPEGNWLGNAGSYSLVPFGGRYFALYLGGNTLFNHVNALDSASMRTNQSGAVAEDILFYPWGDVWEVQGSGGYNFANMPYRDVTTTTDITTARFYSPNFGRWFSPDPAGKGAVQLDDPQTWNMYAYVRNSPATLTDPNGDYYCDPDYATIDKNGTMTVHGGACHLEASDLFWLTNSSGLYSPSAGSPGSSPSGQEAPVSPTPGPSPMNIAPCVAGSVAAGAVVGGVAGALLGGTFATAGGPELTIPGGAAGAEEGTLAGAAVGGAVGSILCSQGSGAGGGGAGGGGGNVRQNRQANDARRQAARETGKSWTRELEEKFHNEITKQGINDYHELVQIAKEVLQGYR